MGRHLLGCAAAVLLGACAGGMRFPVAPPGGGAATASQIEEWRQAYSVPVAGGQDIRFSWSYADARSEAIPNGRGRVQIAAPDSLRLDFRVALGAFRGAAFVLGDTAIWAEPEDKMNDLVPEYPLLWALVGIVRPPPAGARLTASSSGGITAWEYLTGTDTVRYVVQASPRLLSIVVNRKGVEIGRVLTTFGPDDRPVKAMLLVPSAKAKLELKFTQFTNPATFEPAIWRAPSDSL